VNQKRVKKLRRVFRETFGRDPHEGIRAKKDARYYEGPPDGQKTVHNVVVVADQLLVPIEHMDVIAPSEWRQLKSASHRPA
jgi:hypothetical protein